MAEKLTSPEQFFGFQPGSDRKIARWDRIVDYFVLLGQESDRIQVIDLGPSTEGNPFLLAVISAPANLANLEHLRQVNLRLSDPRGLPAEAVSGLIAEGRAVILQSMSLHATEIGGTQMATELAFDLLSRSDEEALRILENVVFLMVPCFNPDGQIMVTDWYNQTLGTAYEGVGLPWLYHKYTGHDNNRDAFQTNMVESQYMARLLFREWIPQAYVDHHHMGSYGARYYVAPYCEPIHPDADPLIWREHTWYGAHMTYRLEEAGKTGVLSGAQFLAWGHLGFHWITAYHNIAGMLTESASARLATPLLIHPSQLRGEGRGTLAAYEPQTNFPNPWPGGLWRLRDIVEQQKISAWATLDAAARSREAVLRSAYRKAIRQTEAGAGGRPTAYVIPAAQHDPLTALKLVDKLLVQGIEVRITREPLTGAEHLYPAGSHVVCLAQPKRGLIKTLLGRTEYPDNAWTRGRDGAPLAPQDTATDTMAEFMGVRVEPVDQVDCGVLEVLHKPEWPQGHVATVAPYGHALDPRSNDAFTAANRLLGAGVRLWRSTVAIQAGGVNLPAGAFLVEGGSRAELLRIAGDLHLEMPALSGPVDQRRAVRAQRIGIYQRYWGGNADEGWTRWLLEQHEFLYATLKDEDIRSGNLIERLDLLVLPHDAMALITGEDPQKWWDEKHPTWPLPDYPPEYRSGLGAEGVEAVKTFVMSGGTLVALGAACEFAIQKLQLKVRDVVKDLPAREFFCPGSTLRACVDNTHPLGYGMPASALVFQWEGPVFDVLPSDQNDRYEVVVSFPERDVLQSGWLVGEERLRRKAVLVVARVGRGHVVLAGLRPQHRAQTHGTFKLLFNALLGGGTPSRLTVRLR